MNATTLMLGVLFSSIGLGYFIYGRRQSNLVFRYTGIALMLYPYFVGGTLMIVGVGIVLLALPRFISL